MHPSKGADDEPSGDPDPNRNLTGAGAHLKQRCYFILSTKSSGSSILQRHLSALTSARLPQSHHAERETLFFTKAASLLGLPQVKLVNSEVPYSRREAAQDIQRFLEENLGSWTAPLRTEADIFRAWTAVVRSGAEDLVEKSPHHLYEESAVRLMERYADAETGVDVHFIGLIRNPLSTLYSSWRRFGMRPSSEEVQWRNAYCRLLDLKERIPERVTIVTYETVIRKPERLAALLGIERPAPTSEKLHSHSLDRWRGDPTFGHHLSEETIKVAQQFGYEREELVNDHPNRWTLRDELRASAWSLVFKLPRRPRRLLLWHASQMLHAIRKRSSTVR